MKKFGPAFLLLPVLIVGCTDPGQAAQDRIQKLPKAGYVRVANLSGQPITGMTGNIPSGAVQSGLATAFFPVKPGELQVSYKGAAIADFEQKVKVEPAKPLTLVFVPKAAPYEVRDELRDGKDGGPQAQVIYLGTTGGAATVKYGDITIGKDIKPGAKSEGVSIKEGTGAFNVSVAGKSLGDFNVAPEVDFSYSIIIADINGKPEATVLQNTPNRRPGKGVPSAAG